MIRAFVVDDHIPTREQAIKDLSTGGLINVVGQAGTSDEAWKTASQLLPDIVLLDLHLPGLIQTFDLIKKLASLKNVRIVVFASQSKASEVQDLLDAGAAAYVLKTDPAALVRMAIVMVHKGSRGVVSPALPRHLTRLSPQERAVLRQLTMRGKLAKAPERLGISEMELQDVITHLSEKLEIETPEQLVKWAKKHGF
ncbi:MAG TPA: response regulator transcription factor [Trichormus sp.]|jgi:two-component system nitrate/nitrite response regulator NarL